MLKITIIKYLKIYGTLKNKIFKNARRILMVLVIFDKGPKDWIYRRRNPVQNEENLYNDQSYAQIGMNCILRCSVLCLLFRRA